MKTELCTWTQEPTGTQQLNLWKWRPQQRAFLPTYLGETVTAEAHDLVMCVYLQIYICICLPTLVDVLFQSADVDAASCLLPHCCTQISSGCSRG